MARKEKLKGQNDISSYHCVNVGIERQSGLGVIYWVKVRKVGVLWEEQSQVLLRFYLLFLFFQHLQHLVFLGEILSFLSRIMRLKVEMKRGQTFELSFGDQAVLLLISYFTHLFQEGMLLNSKGNSKGKQLMCIVVAGYRN